MYAPAICRVFKLSRVVAKRVIHLQKLPNRNIVTRIVPYVVEFTNERNISIEHIHAMFNMMMETEAITIVFRVFTILASLKKFTPK